jgi:hypothetical protein
MKNVTLAAITAGSLIVAGCNRSGENVNTLTNFEGVIPKITLDGKTFENVRFSYPKGSRHEH